MFCVFLIRLDSALPVYLGDLTQCQYFILPNSSSYTAPFVNPTTVHHPHGHCVVKWQCLLGSAPETQKPLMETTLYPIACEQIFEKIWALVIFVPECFRRYNGQVIDMSVYLWFDDYYDCFFPSFLISFSTSKFLTLMLEVKNNTGIISGKSS